MAFRLLDDTLDYEVTSDQFCVSVLEDVAQGIYTMPLIAALPKCKKNYRRYLLKREQLTDDERVAIQKWW